MARGRWCVVFLSLISILYFIFHMLLAFGSNRSEKNSEIYAEVHMVLADGLNWSQMCNAELQLKPKATSTNHLITTNHLLYKL